MSAASKTVRGFLTDLYTKPQTEGRIRPSSREFADDAQVGGVVFLTGSRSGSAISSVAGSDDDSNHHHSEDDNPLQGRTFLSRMRANPLASSNYAHFKRHKSNPEGRGPSAHPGRSQRGSLSQKGTPAPPHTSGRPNAAFREGVSDIAQELSVIAGDRRRTRAADRVESVLERHSSPGEGDRRFVSHPLQRDVHLGNYEEGGDRAPQYTAYSSRISTHQPPRHVSLSASSSPVRSAAAPSGRVAPITTPSRRGNGVGAAASVAGGGGSTPSSRGTSKGAIILHLRGQVEQLEELLEKSERANFELGDGCDRLQQELAATATNHKQSMEDARALHISERQALEVEMEDCIARCDDRVSHLCREWAAMMHVQTLHVLEDTEAAARSQIQGFAFDAVAAVAADCKQLTLELFSSFGERLRREQNHKKELSLQVDAALQLVEDAKSARDAKASECRRHIETVSALTAEVNQLRGEVDRLNWAAKHQCLCAAEHLARLEREYEEVISRRLLESDVDRVVEMQNASFNQELMLRLPVCHVGMGTSIPASRCTSVDRDVDIGGRVWDAADVLIQQHADSITADGRVVDATSLGFNGSLLTPPGYQHARSRRQSVLGETHPLEEMGGSSLSRTVSNLGVSALTNVMGASHSHTTDDLRHLHSLKASLLQMELLEMHARCAWALGARGEFVSLTSKWLASAPLSPSDVGRGEAAPFTSKTASSYDTSQLSQTRQAKRSHGSTSNTATATSPDRQSLNENEDDDDDGAFVFTWQQYAVPPPPEALRRLSVGGIVVSASNPPSAASSRRPSAAFVDEPTSRTSHSKSPVSAPNSVSHFEPGALPLHPHSAGVHQQGVKSPFASRTPSGVGATNAELEEALRQSQEEATRAAHEVAELRSELSAMKEVSDELRRRLFMSTEMRKGQQEVMLRNALSEAVCLRREREGWGVLVAKLQLDAVEMEHTLRTVEHSLFGVSMNADEPSRSGRRAKPAVPCQQNVAKDANYNKANVETTAAANDDSAKVGSSPPGGVKEDPHTPDEEGDGPKVFTRKEVEWLLLQQQRRLTRGVLRSALDSDTKAHLAAVVDLSLLRSDTQDGVSTSAATNSRTGRRVGDEVSLDLDRELASMSMKTPAVTPGDDGEVAPISELGNDEDPLSQFKAKLKGVGVSSTHLLERLHRSGGPNPFASSLSHTSADPTATRNIFTALAQEIGRGFNLLDAGVLAVKHRRFVSELLISAERLEAVVKELSQVRLLLLSPPVAGQHHRPQSQIPTYLTVFLDNLSRQLFALFRDGLMGILTRDGVDTTKPVGEMRDMLAGTTRRIVGDDTSNASTSAWAAHEALDRSNQLALLRRRDEEILGGLSQPSLLPLPPTSSLREGRSPLRQLKVQDVNAGHRNSGEMGGGRRWLVHNGTFEHMPPAYGMVHPPESQYLPREVALHLDPGRHHSNPQSSFLETSLTGHMVNTPSSPKFRTAVQQSAKERHRKVISGNLQFSPKPFDEVNHTPPRSRHSDVGRNPTSPPSGGMRHELSSSLVGYGDMSPHDTAAHRSRQQLQRAAPTPQQSYTRACTADPVYCFESGHSCREPYYADGSDQHLPPRPRVSSPVSPSGYSMPSHASPSAQHRNAGANQSTRGGDSTIPDRFPVVNRQAQRAPRESTYDLYYGTNQLSPLPAAWLEKEEPNPATTLGSDKKLFGKRRGPPTRNGNETHYHTDPSDAVSTIVPSLPNGGSWISQRDAGKGAIRRNDVRPIRSAFVASPERANLLSSSRPLRSSRGPLWDGVPKAPPGGSSSLLSSQE